VQAYLEVMMNFKLLGQSGLKVSELALGTMTFGENWGFGAGERECREMLEAYADAGGNFIDTANKYTEGAAEEILGELISAQRDRWVLATKYSLAMQEGDPNAVGNSRKNMMRSVEASLRRLRTDYIDLYWVHAWDFTTPVDEVMRGLDDLISSGKVLYVGISDAPAWLVAQANTMARLRGWSRFVGLQVQYNLLERTVERELLPMADAFGLGVTAWAPLAGGLLTGKYTRGKGDPDTRRAPMNQGMLTERNLRIAREVDAVADEAGISSVQVAISWVRQRARNIVPIVGARSAAQLKQSIGALQHTLTEAQMARLGEVSAIELGFPHDFLAQPAIDSVVYGDTKDRLIL
jgi:aryl-alcohol dehydrogenase-like predicted oxidoreductase